MKEELVSRIAVQLEPELAQEFCQAIKEDRKKLEALRIIKKLRFMRLTYEESKLLKEVLDSEED